MALKQSPVLWMDESHGYPGASVPGAGGQGQRHVGGDEWGMLRDHQKVSKAAAQ